MRMCSRSTLSSQPKPRTARFDMCIPGYALISSSIVAERLEATIASRVDSDCHQVTRPSTRVPRVVAEQLAERSLRAADRALTNQARYRCPGLAGM